MNNWGGKREEKEQIRRQSESSERTRERPLRSPKGCLSLSLALALQLSALLGFSFSFFVVRHANCVYSNISSVDNTQNDIMNSIP